MPLFKRKKTPDRYSPEIRELIANIAKVQPSRVTSGGVPKWRFQAAGVHHVRVSEMSNRHLLNALIHERKKEKIGVLELERNLRYLGCFTDAPKALDRVYGTEEAIEKRSELISRKKVYLNSLETDAWIDILIDEIQFRRIGMPQKAQFDYSEIEAYEAKHPDEV